MAAAEVRCAAVGCGWLEARPGWGGQTRDWSGVERTSSSTGRYSGEVWRAMRKPWLWPQLNAASCAAAHACSLVWTVYMRAAVQSWSDVVHPVRFEGCLDSWHAAQLSMVTILVTEDGHGLLRNAPYGCHCIDTVSLSTYYVHWSRQSWVLHACG